MGLIKFFSAREIPLYRNFPVGYINTCMERTAYERELLSLQSHDLQGTEGAEVVCQCGERFNILDMYRCLYCDIYRCIECSEKHFGCTVKDWVKS